MTGTVPIHLSWVLLAVGFALPVLVDVFVPAGWNSRRRTITLLLACLLVVVLVDHPEHRHQGLAAVVGNTVLLFLLSVGLSLGFWKPLGVTGRNGSIVKRRNGKNGDNGRPPPA